MLPGQVSAALNFVYSLTIPLVPANSWCDGMPPNSTLHDPTRSPGAAVAPDSPAAGAAAAVHLVSWIASDEPNPSPFLASPSENAVALPSGFMHVVDVDTRLSIAQMMEREDATARFLPTAGETDRIMRHVLLFMAQQRQLQRMPEGTPSRYVEGVRTYVAAKEQAFRSAFGRPDFFLEGDQLASSVTYFLRYLAKYGEALSITRTLPDAPGCLNQVGTPPLAPLVPSLVTDGNGNGNANNASATPTTPQTSVAAGKSSTRAGSAGDGAVGACASGRIPVAGSPGLTSSVTGPNGSQPSFESSLGESGGSNLQCAAAATAAAAGVGVILAEDSEAKGDVPMQKMQQQQQQQQQQQLQQRERGAGSCAPTPQQHPDQQHQRQGQHHQHEQQLQNQQPPPLPQPQQAERPPRVMPPFQYTHVFDIWNIFEQCINISLCYLDGYKSVEEACAGRAESDVQRIEILHRDHVLQTLRYDLAVVTPFDYINLVRRCEFGHSAYYLPVYYDARRICREIVLSPLFCEAKASVIAGTAFAIAITRAARHDLSQCPSALHPTARVFCLRVIAFLGELGCFASSDFSQSVEIGEDATVSHGGVALS